MGPEGGDEFNLIEKGQNYGYPIVSDGDHYDGRDIPDHETRPEFAEPKITWTPVVSPAGLIVYWGDMFPEWRGDALMGGLSGPAPLRLDPDGPSAKVGARRGLGQRHREGQEGRAGAILRAEAEEGRGRRG